MKKKLIFIGLIMIVSFALLMVNLFAGADGTVVYDVQSDWGSGAVVNVTIKNTGSSALEGWEVKWSFPENQKISNSWNCSFTQSGSDVTVKSAGWNSTISPGSSTNFGFQITYSGSNSKPSNITLNGSSTNQTSKPTASTTVQNNTPTPTNKPTDKPTDKPTEKPTIVAPTVSPTITSKPTNVKVACIGDSITSGSGSGVTTPYPKALQTMLGSNYIVKNYGVSGTTMLKKGDRPYWNTSQYNDSSNWKPDIVVIMLGSNDSKSKNWKYKSEFLANSIEMINHYKNLDSHPVVYVATSATVYNGSSGAYGITDQIVTGEVVPLTKQAANETGCTVIDVNTATQGMPQNFPDYVHPNDNGYLVIAKTISKVIGK